jgi:DNA-binding NtrC family response regulator
MAAEERVPLVLVVEDEVFIRWNAVEIVQEAGWRAVEAANSEEALVALAEHPSVEVLFIDVNMPGAFDGLELARQVHRTHPHIQIVVTSGKRAIPTSEIPDDGTFLPKPYGVDDLVRAVERKLS